MKKDSQKGSGNGYLVAPVWKAIQVLEFVAESGRAVALTEVAEALRLPKTTVFRYLHTLSASSLLEHRRSEDRYELGARFRALARTDRSLHRLREVALPLMRRLAQEFNETVNLAIETDGEMVYIEVIESTRSLRIGARIGAREPLHTTALGKAFLAFLDDGGVDLALDRRPLIAKTHRSLREAKVLRQQLAIVRKNGFAIESGENEDGAICIGAPIFDDLGRPVAALSLSAPERRQTTRLIQDVPQALMSASTLISQEMRASLSI